MATTPTQVREHPAVFGRRIYYGWWIVAATVVLGALGGAFIVHGFSAFIVPLAQDFGVGRGSISLVIGLSSLEGALLGPFQGILVDRYGPRAIMFVGLALLGTGFILISFAPSLLWFFLAFIPFIAVGSSAGISFPTAACVGNWFIRKRSMAFGLSMTGWGVGGMLVTVTNLLVETLGWRGAARLLGVMVFVIGLPMAMVMRHRPEQYGYLPDGDREPPKAVAASAAIPPGAEVDFTVKEALGTGAFWLMALSFATRMFVVGGLTAHFIPMMEDKGLSAATGAALLGLFGAVTIPSRLLFGYLGDRLSKAKIAGWMSGVMGLAMLALALGDHMGMILLAVGLYGIAWGGGGGAMMMALRGEYFGRANFATIAGFSSVAMTVGVILGPIFAGYSFDHLQSYHLAYWVFIGFAVASMLSLLALKRPIPKRP